MPVNVISRLTSLRRLLEDVVPVLRSLLVPTRVVEEIQDVIDGIDQLMADLNDEAEDMESEADAEEDVEIEEW